MADTLVIRLPAQPDTPAGWMVVDADGARLGVLQSGPLTLAAPQAVGRRVVALVPGIEVLHAQPELPVRGGARLMQVVPFALEEHVADEVEGLHFALGKASAARPGTPVAALRRDRLNEWLAALRAAQITPDAVYADSAVVPTNPGQIILMIEADRLYVRRPDEPPLVLEVEPLSEALELTALTADSNVILYITKGDWQRHQAAIDPLRERLASLKVQLLPDGALPLLAQQAITDPPINLLQGGYTPHTKMGDQWRSWRVVAILGACFITLNLLGKGVEIWHLKSIEKGLDDSIARVFREAMPGEQNAVDARRRMEVRLTVLHGSSGGPSANLLDMLSVIHTAVVQVPDAKVEAFSFRGTVLDLRVAASDVNSLDRLRRVVTDGGLQAELQSSNASEKGVEGRIQVKGHGTS